MLLLNAPAKITIPFAAVGSKNTIPVPSQIGITAGAASFTDGFPPSTMTPVAAGGVPPSGLDMNGILNAATSQEPWFSAGGGFPFDAAFATAVGGYPEGARVLRSDGTGYWLNTAGNNTTNPESAGAAAAGWVPDSTNGIAAVTMTSASVTLTPLQYGKPIIVLSGALTANLNLIFPNIVEKWLIVNKCTGAFSVTCKTLAGTGTALAAGVNGSIYGDAVNVYLAQTAAVATITPTATVYTTGGGTFNTPVGVRMLHIRMVGAGGGGSGSGNPGGPGGTGGVTSFGTSLLTTYSGSGSPSGLVGSGGAASGGNVNITGGCGFLFPIIGTGVQIGGAGAGSQFSGPTPSGIGVIAAGIGSGGNGAIASTSAIVAGCGGGAGGYLEQWIIAPTSTYSYTVGAGGAAGAAGTSGNAGGAGGAGLIIIEAF